MKNTLFCITGLAIQGLPLSVTAQNGKPNIVVIMTDQQRADLCGRELSRCEEVGTHRS